MPYGVRLSGTLRDLASLEILVDAFPDLVEAAWSTQPDPETDASVIAAATLERAQAEVLAARGLEVVEIGDLDAWSGSARSAGSLAEALRPLRVPGDPLVDEAIFVMRTDSDAPRALLERLLLLGRDDVEVGELTGDEHRFFCVRVPSPPLYSLMRARDQRDEETTAYGAAGPGVFVEWGYAHPLATQTARVLARRRDRFVLIDAIGRWRFAPQDWGARSVYDALEPKLPAARVDLVPTGGTPRFTIRMRLAPGPDHEPEVWLLDEERFFRLEHFVAEAGSEEVQRLRLSRLETGDGRPKYLVRERVQPGVPRLGTRISEIVGRAGFAKNTGTDNLYLPIGRRLLPTIRRDELRRMMGLDDAAIVIVDEDSDGPKIYRAAELDDASLSRWTDYVATDRRVELDRLLERTVFSFPPMDVERPEPSSAAPAAVAPPAPEPRVVGSRPQRPAAAERPADRRPAPDLDDLAEVRDQARVLQARIAEGGCDDPPVWAELGRLLVRLGDIDEAAACLESALFFGGFPKDVEVAAELASLRAPSGGEEVDLVDLAVEEAPSPRQAALLGSRFVAALGEGATLLDDMVQVTLQRFSDPGLPVSKRLAWTVLSTWHHSVDDRLGLTRAREAVLGGLNDRGLSELYDLPRFVRYALALEDDDRGSNLERARAEQLRALEHLFEQQFGGALPELDAMASFVRLLFAVGLMRLGAGARARSLAHTVEHELVAHDPPNQVLFRLLLARMAFEGTDAEPSVWRAEVEQILSAAAPGARRPAAWLAKRSIWLGEPSVKAAPKMRSLIDRMLIAAERDKQDLGEVVTKLARDRVYKLYDWERTAVIERVMSIALGTGNDALVAEVLDAAEPQIDAISILGHRVHAIAACMRGAATLEEEARVDRLVDRVVAVAGARDVPWVRELLVAVNPCLSILRRLGAETGAARLLESLEPVPTRTKLEASLLSSALADGFLQLGEHERADELVERAMGIVFDPELDYVSRFESGALVIDVLRHWPTPDRARYYQRFLRALDHFKDVFTTSEWFEAHKILILERIVDALADSETRQSDRVQSFLDLEEHTIRRKIISDWRDLCGR